MSAPLKMHVETRWYEDGLIEQRTVDFRGEVTMQFLATKEAHIRKALIALGWTPPPKIIEDVVTKLWQQQKNNPR